MSAKLQFPVDLFISHASEDKDEIVRELAELLEKSGIKVWYDEGTLVPGMSLSQSIDGGLSKARFGLIILSPSFFSKNWPQYELTGLKARQLNGENVIVPIWHNITKEEIISQSPPLADMFAYDSKRQTVAEIAEDILCTVKPEYSRWLLKKIRNIFQDIGKAEYQGTDYDYWPEGGLRNLYYRLISFASYMQLSQKYSGAIWLSGPHTRDKLDLHNSNKFGHYNPEFLEWVKRNLDVVMNNVFFVRATQAIFDEQLLPIAKLYYKAYLALQRDPVRFESLRRDFKCSLEQGGDTASYRRYWETEEHKQGDLAALLKHLDADDRSASAVYFWIRRAEDGTAVLFNNILVDVLSRYSPSSFWEINNVRAHPLSEPGVLELLSAAKALIGEVLRFDKQVELIPPVESDALTAMGRYRRKVLRAIGSRWHIKLEKLSFLLEADVVKLRFKIQPDGRIDCSNKQDNLQKAGILLKLSLQCIEEAGPFEPFEAAMKDNFPDGFMEEILFSLSGKLSD